MTTWSVFKDAISNVTQGRVMGAMGILNTAGEPDKRSKKIEPKDGEVVKFTTAATQQSTT